jgi:hypothetical protein
MIFSKRALLLTILLSSALGAAILSSTSSVGVGNVLVQALTTIMTSTQTINSTLSSTETTSSSSTITSSTSTSTTTTSTSTSFSYTSTTSVTNSSTTTSTSYTSTATISSTTLTTSSTSQTESTTSTSTTATTTTVAKLPTCLIATATFGSELSPEVQLLRDFRDNEILRTAAGSGFMVVFNAWYYSFSPYVAGYLSTHTVERTIMKGVLYPLIGILKLSSLTFSAASAFPELAAFLSGLVASSLIGAFYLGLPLSVLRAKVRRMRGSSAQGSLERLLLVALLAGISTLLVGELLASSVLLMIASAVIVLATLLFSAIFTSGRIAKKIRSL